LWFEQAVIPPPRRIAPILPFVAEWGLSLGLLLVEEFVSFSGKPTC
jgi:hypothetical protein